MVATNASIGRLITYTAEITKHEMIYVVLIPAWFWVTLLVTAWLILFYKAYVQLNFRHPVMLSLLGVFVIQALVASSAAIATSQDPLNDYACLTGYFGMWITLLVVFLEAIALTFLSNAWPNNIEGKKDRFGSWLSIWFIFNVMVLLAHMRSAGLCTV